MHLEQMCQSNRPKWSNRGCSCAGTDGGRKHRCPVSDRPIKQHTGPEGRKPLLTGRHQEKRTFQSTHRTHTFNNYTHTEVDKICQVSGTAPRERVDLWRPGESNTQLTNSSFNITYLCFILALHCRFKMINHGKSRRNYTCMWIKRYS